MKNLALLSLGAMLFAGCGVDPETSKKIADLETRLAKVEEAQKNAPAGPTRQPAGNPEEEKAAAAILKEANGHFEKMEYDECRAKIADLKKKYPNSRAARAAGRIEGELAIIGKDAKEMSVEKWFQGDAKLADGKATLLVFWEVWCPHCKREVPKIDATYQKYKDQGFQIVGVTKMTRNITEDQVNSFLKDNNVSYPVAKEQGMDMSEHYGIKGIPAAAVVKDGKVVWRGHPARINDGMIETWIN